MTALPLLAALQAAAWVATPANPTVGDTVQLVRRVLAAPDVEVRLVPLAATELFEPLSAPRAGYAEGTLVVVYSVAFFAPGRRGVAMPSAELIRADGRVETLPGDTAWVSVRSVLPRGDPATLSPMPSLGPYRRPVRQAAPLVALALVALGGTVAWGVARRRTRPRPPWAPRHSADAVPPVDRWVAAGEARAVAAFTSDRLRRRIAALVPAAGRQLETGACIALLAAERPDWPVRELGEMLRALDRARFAPAVSGDVIEVMDAAERLMFRLRGRAAAP